MSTSNSPYDSDWRAQLHAITLYLLVPDVDAAIDFATTVFDATPIMRDADDSGRVLHAQIMIGDSVVMFGQSSDEFAAIPGSAYVYVDDADATHARALAAGAEEIYPPADMPYGDRNGGVRDPQGTCWWISTPLDPA